MEADTYDIDLDEYGIDVLHDNCLVKPQYKLDNYKVGDKIIKPEEFVERSPNKPFYGVILDWGHAIPEYHGRGERADVDKISGAKYSFEKLVEPKRHIAAFSRGRFLAFRRQDTQFAFVKMANVIWIEPYVEDNFTDKDQNVDLNKAAADSMEDYHEERDVEAVDKGDTIEIQADAVGSSTSVQ